MLDGISRGITRNIYFRYGHITDNPRTQVFGDKQLYTHTHLESTYNATTVDGQTLSGSQQKISL